eukprot:TRINITY_DN7988_c0_g1_i1.p1 TRINITY_DN7988_c0_g1~~TRINITY_DN7988_c0_g1_i1.p1  ORF type:complete len:157 (+),score=30.11 TRINITY_DN7988_c0_g1_i1:43-513(+)
MEPQTKQPTRETSPIDDVMNSLLKGVEYDPRIKENLHDFCIRYATAILQEAKYFCSTTKREAVTESEIKLAIKTLYSANAPRQLPKEDVDDILRKNEIKIQAPPLEINAENIHLPPSEVMNLRPTKHIVYVTTGQAEEEDRLPETQELKRVKFNDN